MNRPLRVMMLVDADNVSADVIAQALDHVLQAHGAAHVRRAYCTPESAVKNAALFKQLALRPMVNLSTGKNATDIALAVDALDLAVAERPDVAVIVSSDSDFAPLVLRLREKGCRVEGIGQQGKTSDGSKGVYDDFVDLVHRKPGSRTVRTAAPAAAAPAPRGRRGAATAGPVEAPAPRPATPAAAADAESPAPRRRRAAPAPRPAAATPAADLVLDLDLGDAAASPAPRPAARPPAPARAPAPRPAAVAPSAANLPDEVAAILKAVPPLAGGQPVALGIAAERLRAAGLLARSAASTRLFRKLAAHFALAPARQPNTVQYLGAASPA